MLRGKCIFIEKRAVDTLILEKWIRRVWSLTKNALLNSRNNCSVHREDCSPAVGGPLNSICSEVSHLYGILASARYIFPFSFVFATSFISVAVLIFLNFFFSSFSKGESP